MIQMRTILQVADNSGARKISCILPIGGSTGRYARLGDTITANVKESAPDAPEPVPGARPLSSPSTSPSRRATGSYCAPSRPSRSAASRNDGSDSSLAAA